jgi:tetratricopeptide (TPR) repeat protein
LVLIQFTLFKYAMKWISFADERDSPIRQDQMAETLLAFGRWADVHANAALLLTTVEVAKECLPLPKNEKAIRNVLALVELASLFLENLEQKLDLYNYASRVSGGQTDLIALITRYRLLRPLAEQTFLTDRTGAVRLVDQFLKELPDRDEGPINHVAMRALNLLTTLLLKSNDPDQALACARGALENLANTKVSHLHVEAIANGAIALTKVGRADEALDLLDSSAVDLLSMEDVSAENWATIEAARIQALIAAHDFDETKAREVMDVAHNLWLSSVPVHLRVRAIGILGLSLRNAGLSRLWGDLLTAKLRGSPIDQQESS